ncbi:MAG: T9SS type A sorting domain-containing protein [Candidatus Delongbacteria bacterium]|nr:T9SS type A sorting domain-containing protein [Candidatus Delongbacteria bacterium]
MKKTLFILVLIFIVLLHSQKKILIDNIHGADFIGDVGNENSVIDFYSVFPDDDLTILTPDSLPFDNILIEETISSISEKTYIVDLPDGYYPETPHCLYVYAKCSSEDFWTRAKGIVRNPASDIVAELFEGSGHVDVACGLGWLVELELDSLLSYDIKIGYGKLLFDSQGVLGKYDLIDYDIVIRIKDNCYYAIEGNPPLYENYDLIAIGNALSNGLSFINTDHYSASMADKPFIHFYSNEDTQIDINIEFPGNYTLLSSNPQLIMNKSEQVINSLWKDHKLNEKSDNEIIYEGSFKNKLNFIDFEFFGDQVTVKNRLNNNIDDLFILKYESENQYRFMNISEMQPFATEEISEWEYLNTDQVLKRIKQIFYERGIKEGLLNEEIDHLVNDFHWIESLLYRARINKDEYFGFYHFGKEVYDKLIGFKSNPYPEELNRTMWVMLSFIKDRDSEPIITLDREATKNRIKAGLKVNEYGIVDEYYTNSYFTSENDLFGIDIYTYAYYWYTDYLYFYNNPIALQIAHEQTYNYSLQGFYHYNYPDYQNSGILYRDGYEEYPVVYGKIINDNGQLVVIGTSYFFKSGNTLGNAFLNNIITELVDNRILTGIDNERLIIDNYELHQNYPNPFNPETTISYSLQNNAQVSLKVFNIAGKEVCNLVDQKQNKGLHKVNFNGSELTSGMYLYRLSIDGKVVQSRKMMLLK